MDPEKRPRVRRHGPTVPYGFHKDQERKVRRIEFIIGATTYDRATVERYVALAEALRDPPKRTRDRAVKRHARGEPLIPEWMLTTKPPGH